MFDETAYDDHAAAHRAEVEADLDEARRAAAEQDQIDRDAEARAADDDYHDGYRYP